MYNQTSASKKRAFARDPEDENFLLFPPVKGRETRRSKAKNIVKINQAGRKIL
jgi:hypothetical protein